MREKLDPAKAQESVAILRAHRQLIRAYLSLDDFASAIPSGIRSRSHHFGSLYGLQESHVGISEGGMSCNFSMILTALLIC